MGNLYTLPLHVQFGLLCILIFLGSGIFLLICKLIDLRLDRKEKKKREYHK